MRKVRRVATSVVAFLSCSVSLAGTPPQGFGLPQLDLQGGSSALCPALEQLSLSRPDTDGPTYVSVALFLNDVVALDDVAQSITVDLFLIMRWTDARLADPDRGSSQAVCTLPLDEVRSPVLQSRGVRHVEKLYQDITAIDAAGTVTYVQRLNTEIAVPLDLRDFPFDRHTLTFVIETVFSSIEEVRFVPLGEMSGVADRVSLTGWSLGTPAVSVETEPAPRVQIDRPVFRLTVEAQREVQFYFLNAIAPLTLIIFMSWAVFWIDPQQIARIGLSATAILTLIAYQFAFADLLPRIGRLVNGCVPVAPEAASPWLWRMTL